jgi:hypothetical protein
MSEPLNPGLIGVALEVDMKELPKEVASVLSQALGYDDQVKHWVDVQL